MANLITVDDLKSNYLAGIKLQDNKGTPLPAALFSSAITNAVSWFENFTKIHITPYKIEDEQHDFHASEYMRWAWIPVFEYPVLEVNSVAAIYPTGQTILLFPTTWMKIFYKAGQIQLVPTAGSLSQVLIGQGGSYVPLLSGRLDYFPFLFHVNYTAGFDTGLIPDIVNDIIGLRAAIQVLGPAGAIVIESGIQSKSISIDGLSQSTAVTPGQFGAYSGMVNIYQKRLDEQVITVQQQYKGIPFIVL